MVDDKLKLLSDNLLEIMNHVDDAIYIKSSSGVYTYVNERAAGLIGRPVDNIIGHTDADLFPPEHLDKITALDKQVMSQKASISAENKYSVKDKDIWFQTLISPTFGEDESLTGLIGISREITEQKILNQKLQTYSEEIDIILDNSSDAIYRKDLIGRYVYINQAGAEMMQTKADKIIGKTDGELFGEQTAKRIRKVDREVASSGKSQTFTTQYASEDGDQHWFNVSISPAHDANKTAVGIVGVSKNITDIKLLEMALRDKNEQLITILESSDDAIFAKDTKGVYLFVNKACEQFIGRESADILGKTDEDIFGPEVFETIRAFDQKVMDTGQTHASEECFGPKNQEQWYHAKISPAFSSNGELVGVIGVSRNMTDYHRTQQDLWNSESRYYSLYHDMPAIFLTLDVEGNVVEVNAYGAQKLGYTVEELKNMSVYNIMPPEDKNSFRQHLQMALDNPGTLYQTERRYIAKDGKIIWGKDFARVVFDKDGNPSIPVLSEDLTATKELKAELTFREQHDTLTGLMNRTTFENKLEHAIQTAKKSKLLHGLFILKIDNLKLVKDTLGAKAADSLLVGVAALIKKKSRKRDVVARLEGAEFAVLMENTSLPETENSIVNLLACVNEYDFKYQNKPFLTASNAGALMVDEHVTNTVYAMTRLSNALHSAKQQGKNTFSFYDESGMGVQTRQKELETITNINQALAQDGFVLHAQKIVSMNHDGILPSYEILTRMMNDADEIVMPDGFIPVLEQNKLSHELDDWVVRNTFAWLDANQTILQSTSHFSINLSGQSLSSAELLDDICQWFVQYKIPYHKICFEVTETAAIENLDVGMHFLTTLQNLGCLIALDDFGAGLSSFRYLQKLPIDYVKIDGAFIRDLSEKKSDYLLTQGMHELLRKLGIKTIAEYVESEEVLDKVDKIGIDFAQGYFVGQPIPVDEITPDN